MSKKIKIKDFSKSPLSSLKKNEKSFRVVSLEILRMMRNKISLTRASKELGFDRDSVKLHIRSGIMKRHGRWIAKKFDAIERQMQIYENGKVKSIVVRNSKDASLIGKYFNDVKTALVTGEKSILRKYKRRVIVDAKGKRHKFETRLEKIFLIEESKEEPEGFEVYDY